MRKPSLVVASIIAVLSLTALQAQQPRTVTADLVVYGGTASGVMTAYAAAQQGLKVVLLEPTRHVGGMVTGGLSATDLGEFGIIGGYAREFYRQAAEHYGTHDLDHANDWLSEPHVGEAIFTDWLQKAHVDVRLNQRLLEQNGVIKQGLAVTEIITADNTHWKAKVFADCSYEGDLMAQAKIRYTVGREGTEAYNETLAGVRPETPKHQFLYKISAYDATHHLLPEVDPGPLAAGGAGDSKVQAYNFRLILTNEPANKLQWAKPAGYDANRFALLRNYLADFEKNTGHAPTLRDVTNPVCFANSKCDFNNNGAFSTDYLGKSWQYPDASYTERRRIWDAHLLYTQSFFYFLSTDPSVPESLRTDTNRWGRAKDEFTDSEGWPRQLYIREGRRMIGEYVMHQADLQTDRTKPDSIAMGSYNSDSHNVQRVAMPDGSVFNEGDVQVAVQPYEISFRAILPKLDQASNLLIPVCLSASHVAYSSVRMEPQYMMIGQAAGVIAALAIHSHVAVQKISVEQLQTILRKDGAILHLDQQATHSKERIHPKP